MIGIATNTVITILKNIRSKTGATSKYHIVSLAAKSGLI
jgi:DNA-binding CsgD family transcriptional regulator